MKRTFALATACWRPVSLSGHPGPSITGDYVEVRTAEVYTGGCILGSEGGRPAAKRSWPGASRMAR